MTYTCPICGWPELEHARGVGQIGGPPETCPSCGFEFGTGGLNQDAVSSWRFKWVASGMQWQAERARSEPADWDPRAQLDALVSKEAKEKPTWHYTCSVCGYPALDDPPRSAGGGGSYEICPSCGFEYGYSDDDQGYSYEQWRAKWVAEGMPWRDDGIEPPPEGWDPRRQLAAILGED